MKTALLIAALALIPAFGRGKTVVVLSAELGPYQDALAGVKETLADAVPVTLKNGKADVAGADTIIALGGQAALAEYPAGAALVVAMVADPKIKPNRKAGRVTMLADAASLIGKIKALQPALTTLAVFDVGGAWDGYVKELAAAGVAVESKKVAGVSDVVGALRGIQGKAEALWIPPDPLLISPETFKLISQFCLANKIGLYGPATGLARAGALAGVAPTFKEIGRTAAKLASEGAAGTRSAAKVDMLVNAAVAKALGLGVPAGTPKTE